MNRHRAVFTFARRPRRLLALPLAAITSLLLSQAASADTVSTLIPGTAVLLSQTSSSGGGTTATTSSTNIFSPAAYADYKLFGGEPTTVVDHYPFVPGSPFAFGASGGTSFKDLVYVSSPQGFVYPRYSTFLKSSDLGMSFRVPAHVPVYGDSLVNSSGGGDSHIAVGPTTHRVFFVDLYGQCVSAQVSSDMGERFVSDPLGCGLNPGALDDRQWVAVDEAFGGGPSGILTSPTIPAGNPSCLGTAASAATATCGNVYISFGADSNLAAPTIAMARSFHDGAPGSFASDSVCNLFTNSAGASINPTPTVGADDATPTPCPDPSDSQLVIAGSVIVDQQATHNLYIPFVRQDAKTGSFLLYIARSTDGATTWTRRLVEDLGSHNPSYIFPNLAIDTAGNLYFDWAQDQANAAQVGGETDVYYTFSTNAGTTWVPPINITPETGDSAVFPWMVAGSPGQVDVTYYKANTGLNPQVAFVDTQTGNPCTPPTLGSPGTCTRPNPSVWNVYFGQANNALNTGSNFKRVQISDHPNHVGQICTFGIACTNGGNRNLLDFFTIDIDHLGAANISYADDYNAQGSTFDRFTRQLAGNSVLGSTSLSSLQQLWPITNHAVTDEPGPPDVYNAAGVSDTSCPGMDVTGVSESLSSQVLTINLSLNGPPTKVQATTCGTVASGGIWGAEFWASASDSGGAPVPNNFYVAYVDNGIDPPHAEAGTVAAVNLAVTSHEFRANSAAVVTLGGTCFPTGQAPSTATGACTITLTTNLAAEGIKSGAGLYSITGLSLYYLGASNTVPLTNIKPGDSEQADAATAFDDNGTGSTTK